MYVCACRHRDRLGVLQGEASDEGRHLYNTCVARQQLLPLLKLVRDTCLNNISGTLV